MSLQHTEAEEVECGPACRRMMLTVRTTEVEVDEPRLLRVECESEPVQSLPQDTEDALGVEMIRKRPASGPCFTR
jgi:hypothetical protein